MKKLLRRIAYWMRHRQMEAELGEELEFHRSMKQTELERNGIAPDEAASQARRALGNTLSAIEDSRGVWLWSWLDQFVRDTRVGARALLKTPGFTIFATLILSIGIGAAVTVFTYLNAVFLKPLNIPNAATFVKIYGAEGAPIFAKMSDSTYIQYRDRSRSLAQIGTYSPSSMRYPLRTSGPRTLPLDVVQPTVVSNGLFKAIGVGMVLGRGFEPTDELAGSPNVVTLDEAAWKQYFGSEADILGQTLYLDNTPYFVVGVVPRSFRDAMSLLPTAPSPHIYMPAREDAKPEAYVSVAGRLRPGIAISEAQADLARIATQLTFEKKVNIGVSVERGDRPPSWLWVALASVTALFLVGVFTVLLIACDDISIMLLARIAARQREMGIRLALGGSRAQLIRQLLAENILLSILGGAGATIFMLFASRLMERLPIPLPDTTRAVFDWRVLCFTMLTSLATIVFFGLRPALECVGQDVIASLTPGSRSASQRQARMRSNLVITQITVCTALLITAAVVTRSVVALTVADRGYKSDHLLTGNINFTGTGYDRDAQLSFYRQLLTRLSQTPGVESACIVSLTLDNDTVNVDASNEVFSISTDVIGEGYFRTLRVPIVAGRDFSERDQTNASAVGIVNQTMANRISTHESPVGRRIRAGDGASVEIVGVARDIIYSAGSQEALPVLYRLMSPKQGALPNTVMLRSSGAAMVASGILHNAVAGADQSFLVYNVSTMDDQLARQLLPIKIFGYVTGIPGIFALLLGIVGTYGTMANLVAQRRREIGIRIALGSHPSGAVSLILTEGMKSTSIGIGLGVLGGLIIILWLSRNLYGLQFFDPAAILAMTLVVTATAGAACYIPARRASRVDPMVVLRED